MSSPTSQPFSITVSVAIVLIVGVLHYAVSGIPPQFEEVYAGIGAELPWITSYLIDSPIHLWIAPLLVAGTMVLHHSGHIGRLPTLMVSVLGTLASYLVLMIGLYCPIFLLGRAAVE